MKLDTAKDLRAAAQQIIDARDELAEATAEAKKVAGDLRQLGWSHVEIGKALGVHRHTVRSWLS